MNNIENIFKKSHIKGFTPYALAAFLVGLVGGFTSLFSPAFVEEMNLPYNNTTWTALSMAMSAAAFAPVLGKFGDIIGRRITLLIGIAVFLLGNILTAIAHSLLFMLVARFIVGIGSAAIAPVVISYIVTEFPPDKIAKGFALYMFISSISVIFGPTVGGLVIKYYGWRTMIWICAVLSATVFILCLLIRDKKGSVRRKIENFDSIGAVFILVFFSLVLCVPSFGQNFGWQSKLFLTVLIAAVISGVGLYLSEKKAANPILKQSFIKRKAFILSVLALFLTQGLMQANMTNVIVFVNYTQPQNSVISGYAISIMYIGMSLGAVILGPLADRYEPKKVLVGSLALTGIGCAVMLLFSADTSVLLLAASLGILGFGLGGNGTIFMKVVLSGVSAKDSGAGTGTYGLFRDLAAPFGVAVFVPLYTNKVASLINVGATEIVAAVDSVRLLAILEIICVAAGIVAVLFLPEIYKNKKGAKI
ncbi:MAG: MFS transporter [Acutalibacteraceae bacterium]|nr:MFS transporter [Acutalibacteraceae bacterium]